MSDTSCDIRARSAERIVNLTRRFATGRRPWISSETVRPSPETDAFEIAAFSRPRFFEGGCGASGLDAALLILGAALFRSATGGRGPA